MDCCKSLDLAGSIKTRHVGSVDGRCQLELCLDFLQGHDQCVDMYPNMNSCVRAIVVDASNPVQSFEPFNIRIGPAANAQLGNVHNSLVRIYHTGPRRDPCTSFACHWHNFTSEPVVPWSNLW